MAQQNAVNKREMFRKIQWIDFIQDIKTYCKNVISRNVTESNVQGKLNLF